MDHLAINTEHLVSLGQQERIKGTSVWFSSVLPDLKSQLASQVATMTPA